MKCTYHEEKRQLLESTFNLLHIALNISMCNLFNRYILIITLIVYMQKNIG